MLRLIEVDEHVDGELLTYLTKIFNDEIIEPGRTYPHVRKMSRDEFKEYWFKYAVILVSGESGNWEEDLCGTFYVKDNYIGRCSHICNAGFIVPECKRGRKYGRILARSFPYFARKRGYKSSVFNLVFETNVASLRLWDSLGYRRVGRIKEAINIDGAWVAAIMYQGNFEEGSIATDLPRDVEFNPQSLPRCHQD